MDPYQILLIVLVSLLIVVVLVLIILFLFNKKDKSMNKEYIKEILANDKAEYNKNLSDIDTRIQNLKDSYVADINKMQTESLNNIVLNVNSSFASLNTTLANQINALDNKVTESLKSGFDNNSKSLNDVSLALGQITQAQANLDSLKDQVTSLNDILSNNQKRGRFGEETLEAILKNIYGETHGLYATQYELTKSLRPDAVVFLPGNNNLICIDSKFSFASYAKIFDSNVTEDELKELNKGFKNSLKMEVTKVSNYIILDKTAPYAIMFIPSDGIYAYLQSHEDFYQSIICYAKEKNVIITSPSTLQPIIANIKMLQVNYEVSKNIKEVIAEIQKLRNHILDFKNDFDSFSASINTLMTKRDKFAKDVEKLDSSTNNIINKAEKENLLEE